MCNWEINNPSILWDNSKQRSITSLIYMHAYGVEKLEYAPWLNNDIKRTMNRRDYLNKKPTNSNVYHRAYKTERNRANNNIKRAKKDYYRECKIEVIPS